MLCLSWLFFLYFILTIIHYIKSETRQLNQINSDKGLLGYFFSFLKHNDELPHQKQTQICTNNSPDMIRMFSIYSDTSIYKLRRQEATSFRMIYHVVSFEFTVRVGVKCKIYI